MVNASAIFIGGCFAKASETAVLKVGGEAAEALSGAGMLTAKEGGEMAENSLRTGVDDVARGVEGAEDAAVAGSEGKLLYQNFY